jgi:hypothetical protein
LHQVVTDDKTRKINMGTLRAIKAIVFPSMTTLAKILLTALINILGYTVGYAVKRTVLWKRIP